MNVQPMVDDSVHAMEEIWYSSRPGDRDGFTEPLVDIDPRATGTPYNRQLESPRADRSIPREEQPLKHRNRSR